MKLIFITHPEFFNSLSISLFTQMLVKGMMARGHHVKVLLPQAYLSNIKVPKVLRKWMGYIDQYVIFPKKLKATLFQYPEDTLFVFTDHALGPWIPIVAHRPHIIHCHDLLAQNSALGQFLENPTKYPGRIYQKYIREGFRKGKNFVSVSQKTKSDLHQFLTTQPEISEVVYNGLNNDFYPIPTTYSRKLLSSKFGIDLNAGFVLHVGGNDWYKNRKGVLEIYNAWRNKQDSKLPLILIGKKPDKTLLSIRLKSPYKQDIYYLSEIDDNILRQAYSGASVLLFPSLAEGFGWPIAEAMASGCPVITTNKPPMTEVTGKAGFLIPIMPHETSQVTIWAVHCADVVDHVINLPPHNREKVVKKGIENAKRFESSAALNKIEKIYKAVLDN